MSAASRRFQEEQLRTERMAELGPEIYRALKDSEQYVQYRNADLHNRMLDLIAKIEGWPTK